MGHDRVTADRLLSGLTRLNEGVADGLRVGLEGARSRATGTEPGRITELARQERRLVPTYRCPSPAGAEWLGASLGQARGQVVKVLHGKGQ